MFFSHIYHDPCLCRYNTGTLLMVLQRPVTPEQIRVAAEAKPKVKKEAAALKASGTKE